MQQIDGLVYYDSNSDDNNEYNKDTFYDPIQVKDLMTPIMTITMPIGNQLTMLLILGSNVSRYMLSIMLLVIQVQGVEVVFQS